MLSDHARGFELHRTSECHSLHCNQFFNSWDLRKAPAAEAGGYKVIRNKEHRAAAEGGGPNGEIVQLIPKVEYTWVGLAQVYCMYFIRCGPKRTLGLQVSNL